jgi:hypothetical protein
MIKHASALILESHPVYFLVQTANVQAQMTKGGQWDTFDQFCEFFVEKLAVTTCPTQLIRHPSPTYSVVLGGEVEMVAEVVAEMVAACSRGDLEPLVNASAAT